MKNTANEGERNGEREGEREREREKYTTINNAHLVWVSD
jgi:hypothetical protein